MPLPPTSAPSRNPIPTPKDCLIRLIRSDLVPTPRQGKNTTFAPNRVQINPNDLQQNGSETTGQLILSDVFIRYSSETSDPSAPAEPTSAETAETKEPKRRGEN